MVENSASWSAIKLRYLTIDGDRIAYRLAGAGPRLLLVHGMAGSSETWRYVLPVLSERFTVLAPDLLGQGASDKPRAEYSLGAHVNTLRDLLDALGFDRVTVVGQSLGGGLALQFAYQFPERCERLVLVNSGGLGREVTSYLRMLALPGAELLFPLVCPPPLRGVMDRVVGGLERAGLRLPPAAREIWGSYRSLADPAKRRAFFRSLRDVVDPMGQVVGVGRRLSRTTDLPTLIVWGADDPFIPVSHAVAGHRAMPGSRLEIFEGVGHYPHCEKPERFVRVLEDFVDSTEPGRLSSRSRQHREARSRDDGGYLGGPSDPGGVR